MQHRLPARTSHVPGSLLHEAYCCMSKQAGSWARTFTFCVVRAAAQLRFGCHATNGPTDLTQRGSAACPITVKCCCA